MTPDKTFDARSAAKKLLREARSGALATLAYLAPGLRRALRPVLEMQGRRAKAKYLARH